MKKDEFEKLDAFMERNVPLMSKSVQSGKIKNQESLGWLEYALALGLSCIIGWGVIEHQNTKLENAVVLSEVLEWDVTADEGLEEIEAIAMLEQ